MLFENARNAVTTWKFGDYSKTGGIITASNSTFRNNGRAVEFITYGFTDKSKFDNCEFIVTRTLNHGGYCTAFVTAWGISGVKFRGCNFECKDKGLLGVAPHPKGIYTENANFSVTPLCTMALPTIPCNTADMKPNTFRNLLYGIHATNGSTRTFLVDSAHFDTCMVAVQASNVNNFQVVRSKFDIRPYVYSPLSPKTGVWNDNGTGFKIQNNLFTSTYPVSDYLVGVYSNNTGTAANEIYRNVYQKMYYANNSAATNWSSASNALGLKYKCNTQSNNVRDLQISNGTIGQLQGTLLGSTWLPAANTFSVTPDPVGHIANYGTNHMVYHHANVSNQIPTKYTTANVFPTYVGFPPSDYCKSLLSWSGKQMAAEGFFQAKSSYDNTKYTYENLLDGGNTAGLINQIGYSWPEEAWKLHETLMKRSPFLSMEVLYEISDKVDVLPHALMLDIFMANPHCARDARFLDHLATKADPMPEWMIDMLSGDSQKTLKDQLEGIMAFHGEEWNRHADNLIRYYLTDSTDANPDSVWVWFNRKGDLASAMVLADIAGGKANYSSAIGSYETLLAAYPKLEEEIRFEMNAKIDYYTLLESFQNGGNEYWVLNNDQQMALNGFAESGNTGAHHQAKNILSFFYGYSFENIMAEADGDNIPKSIAVKPANASSPHTGLVKVYPNPANDYATFEYNIPQVLVKKGMVLTIHNLEGKPLQSVNLNGTRGAYNLDVSKLAVGAYIYNLTADGHKLDSGTLIVR